MMHQSGFHSHGACHVRCFVSISQRPQGCDGMELDRYLAETTVVREPSRRGFDHISHPLNGTFESMMFVRGGICDRFLEG